MSSLDRTLRSRLDRSVREARDIAEAGARAVLEQLGVGEATPPAHLSPEQRELRRKLRIHGRQLGDLRDGATKVQELDRLLEEVAYEHWHRMLFARFLAENNLLMHTGQGMAVPVTLEECQELAAGEGARDGWELAARYASTMLPQIFRPDSPVFLIELPPEHQQRLEKLLADLPAEVFTVSDSLGWVYQFWQAKRKDEINKSEVKIGARELPAVTQLFTEPYMVSFLLDNSLGAWWAARRLTEANLTTAETELELRQNASLPGMPLEYLRFIKEDDGKWRPASGSFPGWPEHLSDFKMLDPCCGSGHFLVAILSMLVPMRMELEGLSAIEAVDLVLSQNIHGLEIDKRCVELAAFNLALSAWKYPEAGGYRTLPELNLACSGLAISAKKEDWTALGGQDTGLQVALGILFDQFSQATLLGSLIDPRASLAPGSFFELKWADVIWRLEEALLEQDDAEHIEMGVVAKGLAMAARLLGEDFSLVTTNVPYKKTGEITPEFDTFIAPRYPNARRSLETTFLARILGTMPSGGACSIVLPQNWLFLGGYESFREELLSNTQWHMIARLGSGAFETISGEHVKVVLLILESSPPHLEGSDSSLLCTIEASPCSSTEGKADQIRHGCVSSISQGSQLLNPDSRVVLEEGGRQTLLQRYAIGVHGTNTKDSLRFIRSFWERPLPDIDWEFGQTTVNTTRHFGGLETTYLWEQGNGSLAQLSRDGSAILAGGHAWGRRGVCIRQVGHLPCSLYLGTKYDQNCAAIVPTQEQNLLACWCFTSSQEYSESMRQIDQSLKVTNSTLVKVPFDLANWQAVAAENYPHGLPKPYTDDPTQWIFHGHPCASVIWSEETKWTAFGALRADSSVLQIAFARLLGYRWPAELDPKMELSDESRALVAKCDELLGFADRDGIVSIPAHRGEPSAADRLLNLLAAAYGKDWSDARLMELLANADHAGKTLESWLRDRFFAQHCAMFHQKPFIWHIWDGLKDGFSVLVNYHKLDKKNLETLIYSYLGDWITRQRQEVASKIDGAQDRLAAAEQLKKRLELILEGEAPYDIFVRWKPLEKQPIGWDPDINDGVRLNIRPFMSVPDVGKKGAGVLREKPRIHWEKDRGKDVQSAPWYHLFKGDRINDHHLTLEEKNETRGAKP